MNSDFSSNEVKHQTRLSTLGLVQQCPRLWSGGKLRCDWLELSGQGDPSLQLLLDHDALGPPGGGRFIGISREHKVIDFNRKHFQVAVEDKKAAFIHAQLDTEVVDLAAYPQVGVFVYDSFTALAHQNLHNILAPVFKNARVKAEHFGQAVLVINLVKRSNSARKAETSHYLRFLLRMLGTEVPETHLVSYRSRHFGMCLHRVLINRGPLEMRPPDNTTLWTI